MSKTLGYYSTGHEQGLLPPDSYVTAIKDEDWYKEFELHFNNLLMLYYSERTVFLTNSVETTGYPHTKE